VPDPNPDATHHGGMAGPPPEVLPGKTYWEKLNLSFWVKFERPGEHIVRGRRVIELLRNQDFSRGYALVHPLLGDFKVTVRPKEPVNGEGR